MPKDQTSSAEASRARISQSPERVPGSREIGLASGLNTSGSFAHFDPQSSSWKTYQLCLQGGLASFSEGWPRAGMTRSGIAYPRQPSAPRTYAIESSLLPTPAVSEGGGNRSGYPGAPFRPSLQGMASRGMLPTPRASDAERGGRGELLHMVKGATKPRGMLPTPMARDWKGKTNDQRNSPSLPDAIGGKLHPRFVEWMMGFPDGWTDLDR